MVKPEKIETKIEADLELVAESQSVVEERISSRTNFLIHLLLFCLITAVFLPSIRNGFFYYFGDDPGYVTNNAHVQGGLTVSGIKWAFQNSELGNWHPITWISHMLDCQMYGLKPWGHHLTSVLLHALNTVLLFLVLRRMTKGVWRSLVVALFFGLHPLRVESVAWVAERKDVVAVLFWMLTLLAYVSYAQESKASGSRSKWFYGLTLAFFACGLMSKAIVVTLPFVLLLLDYWPLRRNEHKSVGKLLVEKVPFFALVVGASFMTYAAQKSWGFVQSVEKYSIASRLENALVSYGRYVAKMVWPSDLGFYPHPGRWPTTTILVAAAFVIGVSILAFVTRRRRPWLLVGWLFYLGTLVPVIGFVQLGDVAMADRYSYLPMMGILLALVWELHDRTKEWRHHNVVWAVTITSVIIGCIVVTEKYIAVFKDSVTLWQHNFKQTGNVEVAQYALGLSLAEQGRVDEGIEHLRNVVRVNPENAQAHYNLALMFDLKQRRNEANRHYRETIKYSPNANFARYYLGLNLLSAGLTNDAASQFREMIRRSQDARAYDALGTVAYSGGQLDEAINHFQNALKQNSQLLSAHKNLAVALVEKGRLAEGVFHLKEVLKLDPNAPGIRAYLDSVKKSAK